VYGSLESSTEEKSQLHQQCVFAESDTTSCYNTA
jgi:hypothetical protein